MKTETKKQTGNGKVSAYQKQSAKVREELTKLANMQGHTDDRPDPEKERLSRVSDIYDALSRYLYFIKEQVQLLDAAQGAEVELPDMSWTFVELETKLKKVEQLKTEWWTLSK